MKVKDVCERVDVEEARVDGGEVAVGGEVAPGAGAREGGELLAADGDEREAPHPVSLELEAAASLKVEVACSATSLKKGRALK